MDIFIIIEFSQIIDKHNEIVPTLIYLLIVKMKFTNSEEIFNIV